MEDRNALAADCIVISCCCQCLILQLIIFILLRLPSRMIRKTKRYVKRRLRSRKRAEKVVQIEVCGYGDGSSRRRGGSPSPARVFQVGDDGFPFSDCSFGCCMDEVDRVLEEFSQKGEFGFGSFWGGEVSKRVFSYCQTKQEVDYDCFHHHLIETFGSFNFKQ